METKVCSKCGEELPINYFPVRSDSRDGVGGSCKPCKNERLRNWRSTNSKRATQQGRKYYQSSKERFSEVRPQGLKQCPGCKKVQEASYFARRAGAKNGLSSYCKCCINGRQKLRRASNPGADRDEQKLRYEKNREEISDSYVKRLLSAKDRGIHKLIPESLIEAKRVQLQIKRLLKEKTK